MNEPTRQSLTENTNKTPLDPESDPLLLYLGKVDDGLLADDIDKTLYDSAIIEINPVMI